MRISALFLVCLFLSCQNQHVKDYKQVSLFKGRFFLTVPAHWKYTDQVGGMVDGELVDNEWLYDSSSLSEVRISVRDTVGQKRINVNMDQVNWKRTQDSLADSQVRILDAGLKHVGKLDVGYVKFIDTVRNGRVSYQVQAFFSDSVGYYYNIWILNKKSAGVDFKPTADSIFNSLEIVKG